LKDLDLLLRAYRPDELQEKEKLLGELRQWKQETEATTRRLADIESLARAAFQQRFAELPELASATWRIALRYQPFTDGLPEDVTIVREGGHTIIRKQAASNSYHVCLDQALADAAQVKIRFSLNKQGEVGSAPVPYVGIRDEAAEQIFFPLPSRPRSDEIHEILLERRGNSFTALYKEQVRSNVLYDPGKFNGAPFLFFHMNDDSEIVVHSVHARPTAQE
jgi:hypothetical protein